MNIFQIEERLKEEPTSPLSVRLAGLYVARTRVDEAIELCVAAIERNPKYATAYTILGRCYAANKQYEAAIYCLDKSLSLLPDAEIAKRLSDNWRKSVTTGDSQNVLESLRARFEKLSEEPVHSETLTQTDTVETKSYFKETPDLTTTDVEQNLSESVKEPIEKPELEFSKTDDNVTFSPEPTEEAAPEEYYQTVQDATHPSTTVTESQNIFPEISEVTPSGENTVEVQPTDPISNEPQIPTSETIDSVTTEEDQIFIRNLIEKSLSTSFRQSINDNNQQATPTPDQENTTNVFARDISPAIISTTLAEIYSKQGEYSEAIKIYKALILRRPMERENFEQKIKELESKMNLK